MKGLTSVLNANFMSWSSPPSFGKLQICRSYNWPQGPPVPDGHAKGTCCICHSIYIHPSRAFAPRNFMEKRMNLPSQIVQYVHKNLAKSVTERCCANWSHFKLLLKWYPFSSCSRLGVKLVKMMQTKCPIRFIRNSASCDGFIQKIHPGWARRHYNTN